MHIIISRNRKLRYHSGNNKWRWVITHYLDALWKGDALVTAMPEITFAGEDRALTLERLSDTDGYIVIGKNPESSFKTVLPPIEQLLELKVHSAADVEVALQRFVNNECIMFLNLWFNERSRLHIPRTFLQFQKLETDIRVHGEGMLLEVPKEAKRTFA